MSNFLLRAGYDHPDKGDDPQHDPFAAADMRLARNVGAYLETNYPGHPWAVSVQHAQGVLFITIPALLWNYKYVVHLSDLKGDPGMKAIGRAAGEILERLNLPRSAFSQTQYLDALLSRPLVRRRNDPVPG
jgi:hypothetical protein